MRHLARSAGTDASHTPSSLRRLTRPVPAVDIDELQEIQEHLDQILGLVAATCVVVGLALTLWL